MRDWSESIARQETTKLENRAFTLRASLFALEYIGIEYIKLIP